MKVFLISHTFNLIEVRTSGLMQANELDSIAAEFRDALKSLGNGVGDHALIVVLNDLSVSPARTVTALKALLMKPEHHGLKARYTAFVTRSPLARLQLEQVVDARANIRIFADRDDAVAWIKTARLNERATTGAAATG